MKISTEEYRILDVHKNIIFLEITYNIYRYIFKIPAVLVFIINYIDILLPVINILANPTRIICQ